MYSIGAVPWLSRDTRGSRCSSNFVRSNRIAGPRVVREHKPSVCIPCKSYAERARPWGLNRKVSSHGCPCHICEGMQPQQRGFRVNPFGVIGGIMALVSVVLPWVSFLGIISANLITFVPQALANNPPNVVEGFGAVFALVFVLIGGFVSLASPSGGLPSLLGGVVFLAAVPDFQGIGPIVAIIGGLVALSGYFFPGLSRFVPVGPPAVAESYEQAPSESKFEPPESTAPPPTQKFCPTCGARYPEDYKVCPRDTAELKPLS